LKGGELHPFPSGSAKLTTGLPNQRGRYQSTDSECSPLSFPKREDGREFEKPRDRNEQDCSESVSDKDGSKNSFE